MVGILAAVTMLSAGLIAVPTTMEQATPQDTELFSNKIKRIYVMTSYCVSDDDIDFVWSVEIHY